MTTPVEAAREQAREKTGEFGVQDHAEAGVVRATPYTPSDEDVEAVLFAMEYVNMVGSDEDDEDDVALGDFEGFHGDRFELEVKTVAAGIQTVEDEHPRPLEMTFINDANSDSDMVQVGAYDDSTGLLAAAWFTVSDLTTDRDATGRDAARGIARMLLAERDEMRAKLAKHLGPIRAE